VGSDERGFTIEELAEQAGVPVRTVRFYITERLLPGPGTRGREASYGEEHLLRLRLVRRLSERGQRLAQIREYLDGLTLDEVRALVAEEDRDAAALAAAARAPSPLTYIEELLRRARTTREAVKDATVGPRVPPTGKQAPSAPAPAPSAPARPEPEPATGERWRRIALAPGLELHVRLDGTPPDPQLVRRLLRAAGVADDTLVH
jgi:DNA-binding transcriptional MerR regulator